MSSASRSAQDLHPSSRHSVVQQSPPGCFLLLALGGMLIYFAGLTCDSVMQHFPLLLLAPTGMLLFLAGLTCHSVVQHCPPGRFLLLALGGMLFYLAGLTPLRQYLQRLAGLAPPPRPGAAPPHPPAPPPAGAHPPAAGPPGAGAAPQGGPQGGHPPAGGNPAAAGVARVRPAGGLLHELQAFVVGFFTSLLPGEPHRPCADDWERCRC